MRIIYFDMDCTRPDHLGRQDQIQDLEGRLRTVRTPSPDAYPNSRY